MPLHRGNPMRAGTITVVTIGILIALAAGINLSFGLPLNLSLWPPGTDYTVKAVFIDANAVSRGADVVEAGNVVGQVTGVEASSGQAIVTMRVASAHSPLLQGTVARIRYATLLAQKYIELTPSSSGAAIPDGGTIASDSTVTPVDFDQFLSALDPQTRARLQIVLQQGGDAVAGRQTTINDLLTQLQGLSQESRAPLSTFAAHSSDLDRIVANLGVVSTRLGDSHQQLGDLVGSMNDVTGTLASHDRALAALILHLGNVMGDFDATLQGNEQNFNQTLLTLDPLVTQLDSTLSLTAPGLHADLPAFNSNTNQLTPESGCCDGGAISQFDADGNFLRELLVPTTNQPAAATPGLAPVPTVPQIPRLPFCLPTPPPVQPLPTPTLTPLPCPTVTLPVPTPLPSCMPIPTPTPKPLPIPSVPTVCPPGLPLGMGDWMRFLLRPM